MKPHRLILVIVLAAVAGTGSRAAGQEKSWAGESVMPKKKAEDIKFCDRLDGKKTDFTYSGSTSVEVREERKGWLRIHDGHREGWVKKDDYVLTRHAPAYFHRRLLANPKDAWALLMRGVGWLEKCEPDKAIKDFDECIRLDPKNADAFIGRGNVWSGKREYDKAIRDYSEAIRLDPSDAAAFGNRGIAWSFKKEYGKAIKDYSEAIRLDPRFPLTFNNRGLAWINKKEYDKAIRDFDEAIRLDPKNPVAFNNRGYAWSLKDDYTKAIKDYDEAIGLAPKYIEAFLYRGVAWRAKNEYDKAIKDFDEAIRLDPKNRFALYNRGYARCAKKDYGKAIKDYNKAIRLDPKYAWAHYERSVVRLLDRRPKAVQGFRTVLKLEGWKGSLSTYAVILGHLAARQEKKKAAAKRFLKDSAGKLKKEWPYPIVQFLRGDINEAVLLKLSTDNDKHTESHCFLGMDHALKGHKDAALGHFRWVKEHGNTTFTEYMIAVAELERLEGAD